MKNAYWLSGKGGKGFTLIELLVVVAIVSALVAIVIVNVSSSVSKGKDAAAKANLANALTKGGVFYDANSAYDGWITSGDGSTGDPSWLAIYSALDDEGYQVAASCDVADCGPGALSWCAQIALRLSGNTYCVDSKGIKIEKVAGTCTAGECL